MQRQRTRQLRLEGSGKGHLSARFATIRASNKSSPPNRSQLICKPFGKAAALIELHHQRNKDVQLAHLTEF